MAYHEGDEITPGYEVQQAIPAGPLSERYVIRDVQGVSYEVELLPVEMDARQVNQIAYRSLLFVAGVRHPCLPESQGTIALPSPEEEREASYREVPLWEHAVGKQTLHQLIESVGILHPTQAVEIILNVCTALLAIDLASRNTTGNPFPHLALSPTNIALRENRVPVVLGWANRAAFLAEAKPTLTHNRFASFLDPTRPTPASADRRHDVFALASCLFFLIKGFAPPYQLRISNLEDSGSPFKSALKPILGDSAADLMARSLRPDLRERPSVEAFARALAALQLELEAHHHGTWRACSACGLMMQNDADLCPLCIRDRILPTQFVPPPPLEYTELPPPLSIEPYGVITGLEELATILPRIVQETAMRGDRAYLDRYLRQILLFFVRRGLREFAGDLIKEDGALTDDPYWIASELAHRVAAPAADAVEIARERGAFIRWLRGRESCFRFRKSLRQDVRFGEETIDVVFRNRAYLFRSHIDATTWHKVRRLTRQMKLPIVLIILRGGNTTVPSEFAGLVTLYLGAAHRRIGPKRFLGWLDEYHLFTFIRGPLLAGGRAPA